MGYAKLPVFDDCCYFQKLRALRHLTRQQRNYTQIKANAWIYYQTKWIFCKSKILEKPLFFTFDLQVKNRYFHSTKNPTRI